MTLRSPSVPSNNDPVECIASRETLVFDTIAAGLALGFGIYLGLELHEASKVEREGGSDTPVKLMFLFVDLPILVTGVGAAGSVGYGYWQTSQCADAKRAQELARQEAEGKRRYWTERARTQTREAAQAARNGDCATVRRLAVEVRSTDGVVYAAAFVRDVAIASCLAQSDTP